MGEKVRVRLELGRRLMPAAHAWKLSVGGVVDLDRNVDDRVDIYVDGRLHARGQAIVVGGNLAVRVEEILTPRARTLG